MKCLQQSTVLGMFLALASCPCTLAVLAQPQVGERCASLTSMRIGNATITEAVDVPAGKPFTNAIPFAPPVVITSLPEHCLVHGEVNHHKGADGKEYGDKFEIRMPIAWQGRLLFLGGGGLDGLVIPAIGFQGAAVKPDSKSALGMGYTLLR
jgi:hypothetical protein